MRGPTWWRLTLMTGSFRLGSSGCGNHSTPRTPIGSRSAAHEEHQSRGEEDREDDAAEAHLVYAREERHAEDEAERGRNHEQRGVSQDVGSEEARPPISDRDHRLIHEEERLQIRFDGAWRPALRRHV